MSGKRLWLGPMLLLSAIALFAAAGLYAIDHALHSAGYSDPLSHYLSFDAEMVSNSIGVLSSITAAVLGIIVTVVSIVVQLAATRFTPAITEMFLRDRTNQIVMALYVVGCVIGFWTAFGVGSGWVPRVSLVAMLVMATLGFVVMAPYFAHVFRFLAPENVVAQLTHEAKAAAIGPQKRRTRTSAARHATTLNRTEQLTDIAINAVSQKDKIIATSAVDALRDLTVAYLDAKSTLDPSWFELGRTVLDNPDFASMAEASVADIAREGTWFEFKVLRQYQSIYAEAIGTMRDINYVIAINTRLIAERAHHTDSPEALHLAIKFFNTYLRATLNAGDVRTAYTILNQYRLMADALLSAGAPALALKIANHIKYYGHLSYDKKLGFVTETVAYDLGTLCERAHELESPAESTLLHVFLDVDPAMSEDDLQETSLRGVRKAQIKLATYYLVCGAEDLARTVWRDMSQESAERLHSIRDELLAVDSKDFWEISDRGENFDYLEPERKAMLARFFGWFAEMSGELKAVSVPRAAAGRTTQGAT
ncbi:MAG TPA: DUF2254 family protein [Kofleriaceae bacterium]|nr:DUF2254 family protein [Kofleriaceae bacterium]